MTEAQLQSSFTKYMKQNASKHFDTSVAYELKLCKGKRFPLTNIKEHQIQSLFEAKYRILCHKISDMALGFHPFDGVIMCKAESYVGICFYKPRKPKIVYLVSIESIMNFFRDAYVEEKTKKSITEEQVKAVSSLWITLR